MPQNWPLGGVKVNVVPRHLYKLSMDTNTHDNFDNKLYVLNLRHAYGGRIDPQGYDFICNVVKYRDKKISFCDIS